MFHIRLLHIGHLAKAFALREAPSNISNKSSKMAGSKTKTKTKNSRTPNRVTLGKSTDLAVHGGQRRRRMGKDDDEEHDESAEARMKDMVRKQGRLSKKGGVMISSGTSEFQITGGADLEKLVG